MSKVQADNQIRFQDLEGNLNLEMVIKKIQKKSEDVLPGSSQPQDLGSISYKDNSTNETSQQTQSIDRNSNYCN